MVQFTHNIQSSNYSPLLHTHTHTHFQLSAPTLEGILMVETMHGILNLLLVHGPEC